MKYSYSDEGHCFLFLEVVIRFNRRAGAPLALPKATSKFDCFHADTLSNYYYYQRSFSLAILPVADLKVFLAMIATLLWLFLAIAWSLCNEL